MTTGRINRAEFIKRAGAVVVLASAGVPLGAGQAGAAGRGLKQRGVTYDTGTLFGPGQPLTRLVWSAGLMHDEIRTIDDRLHCDSVQIFGSDIERLVDTSTAALERGMHVWIQPRLFDHPQPDVLEHLARTARAAERLRRRRPGVSLIVGCEAPLFTPGIVPGETWPERLENVADPTLDWAAVHRRLDAFLAKAATTARRNFSGKITYAAATWEEVDWRRFDFVGLDYYAFRPDRAGHARELDRFRRWGKPITICEFGTCTFEGAPELEGGGWRIVDWSGPVPVITGDPVRSERVQADHILGMLDVFESQNVHSAHVYTFIQPDLPHSTVHRHDLDMASFGVVAVIREHHEDPASRYRWRPKLAFHRIAGHFRARRQ